MNEAAVGGAVTKLCGWINYKRRTIHYYKSMGTGSEK